MYKWKVQSVPTGQWRSFERRGWPDAIYGNGELAAMIQCEDDYVPAQVRTGLHPPLTLLVADYSNANKRVFRKAKVTYATLEAAKQALARILEKNPGIRPEGLR